jgi:hypothetical protein
MMNNFLQSTLTHSDAASEVDGSVRNYSISILGRSSRLVREIEVICADEGTAIELARQWVDDCDVELWRLDRIIGRFIDLNRSWTVPGHIARLK